MSINIAYKILKKKKKRVRRAYGPNIAPSLNACIQNICVLAKQHVSPVIVELP